MLLDFQGRVSCGLADDAPISTGVAWLHEELSLAWEVEPSLKGTGKVGFNLDA